MSKSVKKYQALLFGFASIISVYMAVIILKLCLPTISLPTSDYFSVFTRYLDFSEGRMSFLSFVLSKHVDHNHSFVYLLSLIDISVDDGRLRLLHWTEIASHFAVYGLILYAAFKLDMPINIKGVVLLFISSQVFAIQGAETWVFPFQVVLPSFRLFFIAGLFLFCRAIISHQPPHQKLLHGSLLLLLVAALSHGSGIVIFALIFMVGSIWGGLKVVYISLGYFAIFILHEIAFPSNTPLTELVTRIPIIELCKSPYYLAFLLGNSFAWGAPAGFQVAVGITGILLWMGLLVHFLKNHNRVLSPYSLFFIALSTFSLAGGGLSILLNLSYMEFRGVNDPPPLEYFLASRYLITTSGFWIGIAVVGLVRVTSGKQIVLSICLICSSAAAVWEGHIQKSFWQNVVEQMKISELVVSNDTWEALPAQTVRQMLLLPTGHQFDNVLQAQKRLGLGPYASEELNVSRKYVVESTADISDANWSHGVAKGWAGFVVVNLPANKLRLTTGRKIRFADGEIRVIISQNQSGIYLNIVVDGMPLDDSLVGYPNKFEVIE